MLYSLIGDKRDLRAWSLFGFFIRALLFVRLLICCFLPFVDPRGPSF